MNMGRKDIHDTRKVVFSGYSTWGRGLLEDICLFASS